MRMEKHGLAEPSVDETDRFGATNLLQDLILSINVPYILYLYLCLFIICLLIYSCIITTPNRSIRP